MDSNNYQFKKNKLRNICKYNTGKTPTKEWYANKGNTKIIKFRDIKEDGSICYENDEDGWVKEEYSECSQLIDIEEKMILLTSSAHSSEHIGKKITLVKEIPKAARRYCYVGEITGIKSNSEDVSIDWIFYYLQSSKGLAEIAKMVEGMHLNPRPFGQINVLYPPKEVQPHILSCIQSVDEVIAKTKEKIVAIQRLKQTVLKQIFAQGIPGRHKEFNSTKIGKIPKEWQVATLMSHCGDYSCVRTGPFGAQLLPDVFDKSGVRMVNITDIGEGSLDFSTEAYLKEDIANSLVDYQLQTGDLVFSRVASVGRVALICDYHLPLIMSSNCIRLRPGEVFNSTFLMLSLIYAEGVARQVVAASTGGARPIVTPRLLRRLLIPKPDIEEQNQIIEIIENVNNSIKTLIEQMETLNKLKRSLLQNLLTGKVRVNLDGGI
ncbi:restriction endonuclease subunit S [Microcoleus sp. FACHB-53]|nr:restriction endonuclease subunit S [Microcoleus sp. FACHB-53]